MSEENNQEKKKTGPKPKPESERVMRDYLYAPRWVVRSYGEKTDTDKQSWDKMMKKVYEFLGIKQ